MTATRATRTNAKTSPVVETPKPATRAKTAKPAPVVSAPAIPAKPARISAKQRADMATQENERILTERAFALFDAGSKSFAQIQRELKVQREDVIHLRGLWEEREVTRAKSAQATKPAKTPRAKSAPVATVSAPVATTRAKTPKPAPVATTRAKSAPVSAQATKTTPAKTPAVKTPRPARELSGIALVRGKKTRWSYDPAIDYATSGPTVAIDSSVAARPWNLAKLPWDDAPYRLVIYSRSGARAWDMNYPENVYYRTVSFRHPYEARDYVDAIVALNGGALKSGFLTAKSIRISIYRNSGLFAQNEFGKWTIPVKAPATKPAKTPKPAQVVAKTTTRAKTVAQAIPAKTSRAKTAKPAQAPAIPAKTRRAKVTA